MLRRAFITSLLAGLAASAWAATIFVTGPLQPAAAPTNDPQFANVVLLACNDNAADGTTTFDDQSNSNHTLTGTGGVAYSNVNPPAGMTTSCLFDGVNNWINGPTAHANFVLPGDFVIDWFGRDDLNADTEHYIFSIHPGGSSGNTSIVVSSWATAGVPGLYINANTTTGYPQDIFNYQLLGASTYGTQKHHALVRSGTNWYFFIAGLRTMGPTSNAGVLYDGGGTLTIQIGNWEQNNVPFTGKLGPFRVTKGSDRGWTGATIAAPTAPFPTN